ncbi:MAG: peptide deformylase [Bacillota bacterium]|nr:peptide deformylase [Bacillota bacterium]
MAIRKILKIGDELLYKKSHEVTAFDERLWGLLDDMAETMKDSDGAGLAAVQVGILRRAVVIDAGEGITELLNPKIIASEGTQYGAEGCLSVPGKRGDVMRPMQVTFEAQNRNGEKYTRMVTGLFARAVCHELDHLEGKLYVEIADNLQQY